MYSPEEVEYFRSEDSFIGTVEIDQLCDTIVDLREIILSLLNTKVGLREGEYVPLRYVKEAALKAGVLSDTDELHYE